MMALRNILHATAVSLGVIALLVTALCQHPNRAFDRLRRLDLIGFAIPNWRFFAPEPAMHDFHLLHRVLDAEGVETPWVETHTIHPRKLVHMIWFPDRRSDKALFDAASDLAMRLGENDSAILCSTTFRLLREFVRARIDEANAPDPRGFQFLLARSTGYDTAMPPDELLISPFIPWSSPSV